MSRHTVIPHLVSRSRHVMQMSCYVMSWYVVSQMKKRLRIGIFPKSEMEKKKWCKWVYRSRRSDRGATREGWEECMYSTRYK